MESDAFLAEEKQQQWQDQRRKLKFKVRHNSVLITQFDTKNKVQCKIATAITAWHQTPHVALGKIWGSHKLPL